MNGTGRFRIGTHPACAWGLTAVAFAAAAVALARDPGPCPG
jgi:hypothetical protein